MIMFSQSIFLENLYFFCLRYMLGTATQVINADGIL